jgi:hypothetical protein
MEDQQFEQEHGVDLLPCLEPMNPFRSFQRLKELFQAHGFCIPAQDEEDPEGHVAHGCERHVAFVDDNESSSSIGLEPIILHPYQNLKNALQYGFCEPLEQYIKENIENLSLVPTTISDETTEVILEEEEEDDDEDEEIVTLCDARRISRIGRALETFLSGVMLVYFTIWALRRMDGELDRLVEFAPQNEDETWLRLAIK